MVKGQKFLVSQALSVTQHQSLFSIGTRRKGTEAISTGMERVRLARL